MRFHGLKFWKETQKNIYASCRLLVSHYMRNVILSTSPPEDLVYALQEGVTNFYLEGHQKTGGI